MRKFDNGGMAGRCTFRISPVMVAERGTLGGEIDGLDLDRRWHSWREEVQVVAICGLGGVCRS